MSCVLPQPYSLSTHRLALEGQTHWKEHNVLGSILCDLWVGFFWVHQELFTFRVFVQSPYPQTSVLAPPMSSMALDLYEPRLLAGIGRTQTI